MRGGREEREGREGREGGEGREGREGREGIGMHTLPAPRPFPFLIFGGLTLISYITNLSLPAKILERNKIKRRERNKMEQNSEEEI